MKITGKKFLKEDSLPLFWCSGCGNGILLGSIIRAMEECEFKKENTVVVTGIGCWGKADDYFKTHSFHGTHGRAIPIATGIKFANPELNVIALVGDGDGATIGGNHLIHAARRNADITVIMSNNLNYGMTGGQYSGSTPFNSKTSTSIYGHVEEAFDIANLVQTSGAGYVAKGTVANPNKLQKYIKKAFTKESGFRFIEVINICPTHFGKANKLGDAPEMLNKVAAKTVNIKSIQDMNHKDLKDKIIVGEYCNEKVDGYLKRYTNVEKSAVNK